MRAKPQEFVNWRLFRVLDSDLFVNSLFQSRNLFDFFSRRDVKVLNEVDCFEIKVIFHGFLEN